MISRSCTRALCATLVAFVLAACSSGGDEGGGLLNEGNGGGGTSTGNYIVTLDGPSCIYPGETLGGFTATLKTASGALGKGVFVALQPSVGRVSATGPDGSASPDGANTGENGVTPFTYTAPNDPIENSVTVSIKATAKRAAADAGTATRSLELRPASSDGLAVAGPKVGDTRPGSGAVSVNTGELLADLLITAVRPAGCGVAGPVVGANVTVTPKLTGATVALLQSKTLVDGTAHFNYQAPAGITVATPEELTVRVGSMVTVFRLTVNPPPPPPAVRFTVRGPTTVSPGVQQSGYTATVTTVSTAGVVQPREGTKVSITLSDGSVPVLEPNSQGLRGVADANGEVPFSVTPKASATTSQTIVVTAKPDASVTSDTTLTNACKLGTSACTATLDLEVQPDTFRFTAPTFGARGAVGRVNAVDLKLEWKTAGGAAVPACVNLSATFQGSGTAPYLLIISDDPVPPAQVRQIRLDNNGQIPANSVGVFSDRSGFVQVTATENRNCNTTTVSGELVATTGVQFADEVCASTDDGRNCVDLSAASRTAPSPDASGGQRVVPLTLTVLNNAYQPSDGTQVLFSIETPAAAGDPNERVFPGGGTTNANGVATSQYYVPNLVLTGTETRTVIVRGCVRNPETQSAEKCSRRTIVIAPPTP